MLPELSEIAVKRKALGLTQKELAELAGVSQSMIAKIENNLIMPSYEKARKIFTALEKVTREREKKAIEIATQRVIYATKNESVANVIRKFEKYAISQMPVLEKGRCIGSVSEKSLVANAELLNRKPLREIKVGEIMNDSLPCVSYETPASAVRELLRYSQAVLLTKNGKICGIVTKADMIKLFRK
ncbi:MAG: CBS domain-containing protein [Candidatus Diapherotrites archaeon]|nr:CBS domain-containing protein [Candidatus Diapherotrites archaeon]